MRDDFKKLIATVARLNELLEDPQVGLISWCVMYGECMNFISDYWKNNWKVSEIDCINFGEKDEKALD